MSGPAGEKAARLEDLVNVLHKGRWVLAERSASQRQATRTVIQLRVDAQGPIYAAKYKPEGEGGQRNVPKSYSRDATDVGCRSGVLPGGLSRAAADEEAVHGALKQRGEPHCLAPVCAIAHLLLPCCCRRRPRQERRRSWTARRAGRPSSSCGSRRSRSGRRTTPRTRGAGRRRLWRGRLRRAE